MSILEAIRAPLTAAMAVNVFVVLPALALLSGGRFVRRVALPPSVRVASAASTGFALGSAVLVTDGLPVLRLAIVAMIVAAGAVAVLMSRITVAGVLVAAAGAPWLVYQAAAVADSVLNRRSSDEAVFGPSLVAVATVVFGLWLIGFQRGWDAAHPPPTTDSPSPTARRWDALSRHLFETAVWTSPPVVAAAAGLAVVAWGTGVVTHGRPFLVAVPVGAVAAVVGAFLLAAGVAFGRSAASRRALEAFVWLSESEYDRISALARRRVRPSMADLRRFVATVPERPDNRWIRVELLAAEGDVPAARAMADRMPETTAFERFERVATLTWLDWIDGRDDDRALQAAAAEVDPSNRFDRGRVDVMLAIAEARRLLGTGARDPLAPLRAARERLGPAGDRAIWRFVRRTARNALPVAATLDLVVLLLDRVGST